jgi:hypothetical protein
MQVQTAGTGHARQSPTLWLTASYPGRRRLCPPRRAGVADRRSITRFATQLLRSAESGEAGAYRAKPRVDLVIARTVPHLDAKKTELRALRFDGERMLPLRARTFAPIMLTPDSVLIFLDFLGEPGGTRTHDPKIKSLVTACNRQ